MTKLKLKKQSKLGIIIIVGLIIAIIGINWTVNTIKQKQYEKSNEYKLITLGYSEKDTKTLLSKYKNKEIEFILNNKKDSIYINILKEKYFIYSKLYDYLDYYKDHDGKDLTSIVEIVNTNRHKEYYEDSKKTDISKKELMLVNKYYYLDETYEPQDLVKIPTTYAWGDYGSQQVTKDTYDAFLNLWNASHEAGYYLMVSSSYRTYAHQKEVYDQYEKSQGLEYADQIAARPGYSEHQTGYSLDIFEKGLTQKTFQDSESYLWLKDNAHKYGFIERYPEDKVNITGYTYESWHYRYVGVDAATYIYQNHITFDEYYAYFTK